METAKISIKYILAKRRLMYLWEILSRPSAELIRRVYDVMKIKPVVHDWFAMIEEEKRKYDISMTDEDIQNCSRGKFKSLVSESVDKVAFSQLIATAQKQSKCREILKTIDPEDMKIRSYLISDKLVKEEQLMLFSLRSFSFSVKSNFHYLYEGDMRCRACLLPDSIENEVHICQTCESFKSERNNEALNFHDVFGPLKVQIDFIRKFKTLARKWKLLLEIGTSTIAMDPLAPS